MSNETKAKALKGITGRIVGERHDAYWMDYSSGVNDIYLCIPADEAREFLYRVEDMAEERGSLNLLKDTRALLALLPKEETDGSEV